jgi:hypothetical protein
VSFSQLALTSGSGKSALAEPFVTNLVAISSHVNAVVVVPSGVVSSGVISSGVATGVPSELQALLKATIRDNAPMLSQFLGVRGLIIILVFC